jgi:secernin
VKDIRTISNALSIGHEWYLSSPGLVESAISRGLWPKHKDFDFASCYSDMIYTRFGAGRQRQCRTTDLLRQNLGKINVADGTAILRDHGEQAGPGWSPANGLMGMQVCAHAGFGPVRSSQSVGSMVSQIRKDNQTHWVTGTSAPCTSIFKPVWIDAGLPDLGQAPGAEYNQATLFWQHEVLHREVLRDYPTRLAAFRQNRDDLETRFRSGADAAQPNLPVERLHYSRRCFEEAEQATLKWLEAVQMTPLKNRMPLLYGMAWRSFDQQSKRSA